MSEQVETCPICHEHITWKNRGPYVFFLPMGWTIMDFRPGGKQHQDFSPCLTCLDAARDKARPGDNYGFVIAGNEFKFQG